MNNQDQNGEHVPSSEFNQLIESIKTKAIKFIPKSKLNSDVKIGKGGFGNVYRGKWNYIDVAIKQMILSYSQFKIMEQEMTFMAANPHPSLVTMYGVSITEIKEN